jgi:hypothetical protein
MNNRTYKITSQFIFFFLCIVFLLFDKILMSLLCAIYINYLGLGEKE